MTKKIIHIAIDMESDGPAPLVHSMLSLGAVAIDTTLGSGETAVISKWSANFEQLPDATTDPDTMKWWATQPEAWAACRESVQDPATAMRSFEKWVKGLPGKPIATGFPAGFDFTFVYVYCVKFLGQSPFGFAAFDFKTFASTVLHLPYNEARKRNFPKHWFAKNLPHTHKALDDALEQGVMMTNAMEQYEDMEPPHDGNEAALRAWLKRQDQIDPSRPTVETIRELLHELDRLRSGIRRHRDEKGHDRCWLDDLALYEMLPEGVAAADLALPPRDEFLRGCERYYELRRAKTKDEADAEARRLAAEGKLGT